MLILTRAKNERIIIGDDVWVIFLGLHSNDEAKIGFVAPHSLSINREEVHYRIKTQRSLSYSGIKHNVYCEARCDEIDHS